MSCPQKVAAGDWAPLTDKISELYSVGRWSAGNRFSWGVAFIDWPCSCAPVSTEMTTLLQLSPSSCRADDPCSPFLAQGFVGVLL